MSGLVRDVREFWDGYGHDHSHGCRAYDDGGGADGDDYGGLYCCDERGGSKIPSHWKLADCAGHWNWHGFP